MQALRSQLMTKIERLSGNELQTVLDFVNFLEWRSQQSLQLTCTAETETEALNQQDLDSQLESVEDVLVLKTAQEPVNQPTLETPLEDTREARLKHLMSW